MNIDTKAAVIYETQILDGKTGAVIKRNAPKRNLILDSGLNKIATKSWWEVFGRCYLGSGTTPTKRDSGAITITISGGVATASAGYFEAADVGRLLKLDSGQEAYINAFTSTTEVSLSGASDDAASEATIWYVNETTHGNNLVSTTNTSGDSGDVTSSWDGSKIEHKRTFVFPAETEARTYREIGWSDGGSLFGRDLIPGGGDSIAPGQQYKVVVRLQVTPSPLSQVPTADVGLGGWNTEGDAILMNLYQGFHGAGSAVTRSAVEVLDPCYSTGREVILREDNFSLPAAPATSYGLDFGSYQKAGVSKAAYVTNSFELVETAVFGTGSGNGTFYGMQLGRTYNSANYGLKFDNPQTKDSDHKLTIAFKWSWGRTLVN